MFIPWRLGDEPTLETFFCEALSGCLGFSVFSGCLDCSIPSGVGSSFSLKQAQQVFRDIRLVSRTYQRWARVPGFAFPCSRYFRNVGARERKFYTRMPERGTRKNMNAKFASLWRDDTVLGHVLRGEVEGGDCGRDRSLTSNRLPASRLVYTAHAWRGGVVARWRVNLARLIPQYTHSAQSRACD